MKRIAYHKNPNQSRKEKAAIILLFFLSTIALILWYDNLSVVLASIGTLLISLYFAKSTFGSEPTVLVDHDGIKTRVNSIGLVAWKHIKGFEKEKGVNSEFIMVLIDDIDELLAEKGKVAGALMKSNVKKMGSPVVIPKQEFGKPLDEVLAELKEAKTAYDKASQ